MEDGGDERGTEEGRDKGKRKSCVPPSLRISGQDTRTTLPAPGS